MDEGILILKEELESLPKAVRDYVLGGEWLRRARNLLSYSKFSVDQKTAIENEILLVIVGLVPIVDLADNIEREVKIDYDTALMIAEDICENILNEANFDNKGQARVKMQPVGFEEAILNQARAMRPAVVSSSQQPVVSSQGQASSQVSSSSQERKVHDYKQGDDPYREPLG